MKTDQAKEIIIASLKEKGTVTAQEINYASKGKLPFVQIYGIMSSLIKNGSVKLNEIEGKKSYTLINANKLMDAIEPTSKIKPEKIKPIEDAEESKKKEKPTKTKGRDLTKYTFNGVEMNKSRLALAIITFFCNEKKPSHKMLAEIFPLDMIPPYGTWSPLKSAIEKSAERPRFFIAKNEVISTKQGPIAISNQWTKDRILKLIAIAKKLGYKIQ